jgi:hypothetical protein
MLEGADKWFRIERVLVGERARPSRCRYGGVGQVLNKVFDYEVFALEESAGAGHDILWQLTENLSRVNCGPRIDVLEVWCERMEAVSMLDMVRSAGSM